MHIICICNMYIIHVYYVYYICVNINGSRPKRHQWYELYFKCGVHSIDIGGGGGGNSSADFKLCYVKKMEIS